ncbi:asparaginase [Aquamicrobium sp. LC103]|uniref:asparaginase n=1 Tax=Aquamicrobium sp. LC103 TaxID=1120658 RepID=UPI00063EC602|nr:asparaginase [Aquamicrobium sp. LC103]TKT81199.1 asparaginase [Aquamicrobium sp. LC103]
MANPILVEVFRGETVESVHRGSVAVVDGDGKVVLETGDVDRPVFPRSAVKAIQALPFVESGAADAYGFEERHIALAGASHSGQPEHAELALSMLKRAGMDETALECGAHWPTRQDAALDLARKGGRPSALHNNCSGKHSGFVCTCRHLGIDPTGYVKAGHKSQEFVREAMEAVTGAAHAAAACGTDGCSIPTYAVPLRNLALGFARMATGAGLAPEKAKAAKRILSACMAEPFYVAGTDRFDTRLMQAAKGRLFAKVGAEGVYCAAIPELGFGIALKCDDGAARAAEVMVASVLARLLPAGDPLVGELGDLANPQLTNWNGIKVGRLQPAATVD